MTSSLRDLKVYTTYPHSCSYLEEREATTLFVDPRTTVDSTLYSKLSVLGFRRSGSHLYRPHCGHCNACIPARVPVARYQANRSQRRALKLNNDLDIESVDDIGGDDFYELYRRYIEARHPDGDMYPPAREQYESFLSDEWGVTQYHRMQLNGETVAVAVVDQLEDGLSAIYTFYDPAHEKRSLGTFAIVWLLQQARLQEQEYLYLGYWIKECQKMAYKIQFRPLELYINGRWVDLL